MNKLLQKVFSPNEIVWAPFLPVAAVIFALNAQKGWFIVCAALSVIFYGYFAYEIHNINLDRSRARMFDVNQVWFNAFGAFVGWAAFYTLLFPVMHVDVRSLSTAVNGLALHADIKTLVLVVLSFLGLTGYIPYYALLGKE